MTTAFTDGVIGAIRLGAVVGLCICGFLAYRQLSGSLVTLGGCAGDWNCEEIFKSRWGSILGIPVVLLAVAAYVTIFVLSVEPVRKLGRYADIVLGGLGIALLFGSLWFVGLQISFGVKCTFCLLAQFVGIVVGGMILKSLCEAIHFKVKVSAVQTFALAALLSAALIGGNFISSGNELSKGDDVVVADGGQVYEDGFYKFPNLGLSVERGKFPTLGNPRAQKAVVVLLDYSTISGQLIHPHLTELVDSLGDQLAIIIIPVPLDNDCNEFCDSLDSANACKMATYAYAAWEANPRTYKTFHDFLMQGGTNSDSGSIGGVVWNDSNSNGRRDPGEPGIPGVRLNLIKSLNVVDQERITTDDSGQFVFSKLRAGLRDMKYQIKVADSNFSDEGALLGMINTAGSGEDRNASVYYELTNSSATLTGRNFGYVHSSAYDKASILADDEKASIDPLAKEQDLYLRVLLRCAGDAADSVTKLLPDFSAMDSAVEGNANGIDWRDENNPVLEKLQDGTVIYGDLRHRSPILPIVVYGDDQMKKGSIDESPMVFVRKVRDASGLKN